MTSGLSIYDTMQFIRPPVATLVMGQAASMGSLLLAAGEAGHARLAAQLARSWSTSRPAATRARSTDIMIHAREVEGLKRRLNEIYEKHTGRTYDEIENALERDRFLSPEEAKDFGLIDQVFEKRAAPDAA